MTMQHDRPVKAAQMRLSPGYQVEDWRIRRHLQRVEQRLRIHVTSVENEQQATRVRHLDNLRTYWQAGIFPRNTDRRFARVPCFIDRDGRACAVAHLIIQSGHADLAEQIDQAAHNARVRAMNVPELNDWVAQSGLTVDELALIQPSYTPPTFAFGLYLLYVPLMLVVTAVTGLTLSFNRSSQQRHGWQAILPAIIGVVGAVAAFYLLGMFADFAVHMVLYFFRVIPMSEVCGTSSSMCVPSSQWDMAVPLLIFVVAYIGTLIIGLRALLSSLHVLKTELWRKSPQPQA